MLSTESLSKATFVLRQTLNGAVSLHNGFLEILEMTGRTPTGPKFSLEHLYP